jgi:hypothetical protein
LVILHDRLALAAVGLLAFVAAGHGDEVDGNVEVDETISNKVEKNCEKKSSLRRE